MMKGKTDTSEKGFETIIVGCLVNRAGYVQGHSDDFDRAFAVDLPRLIEFLNATQPLVALAIGIGVEGPSRQKFLVRLDSEISKKGIISVLRNGIKHGPHSVALYYATPTPGNQTAEAHHAANIFSVTRQLHYSQDTTQKSLDLCIFINGLPIATFELKNSLTKQTVEDAVQQYKRDRNPREPLFRFGRCMVHFTVDDHEVRMCTHLKGPRSWFLPFNKGWNDGAGNPPSLDGTKTAYLWEEILSKPGLCDIIENYAQIIEDKTAEKKSQSKSQVFPRYHQLTVVRKLLADVLDRGVGRRYLIQHSAGSGKSNSIAWLAHQLVGLERDGRAVFDSIVVVTDRRVLDRQIRDTIRQFAQVDATIGYAERSDKLREFLRSGRKIIISTIQKFPVILDQIGNEHRGSKFAIIIDEAHSSQGGKATAAVNSALSEESGEEEETYEDKINKIMESRKLLANASYFAFTATPKNKTLEMFGEENPGYDTVKFLPFHTYSMKQAIQEGFILDVLANYTPVSSYYRLAMTSDDDPEFETRKARKKLRKYVEGHAHAIRQKAEIIVNHFTQNVIARYKIDGRARAMVVCSSVDRAIRFYKAISAYLLETKSPWRALVAFSGEREDEGQKMTESSFNQFPSSEIEARFREDPYRFLVVAEKFQTGYDEPLLHSMYVEKPLEGVKAVQTLSRLNRAHPAKSDTFVLDFVNSIDTITEAFSRYYRTTILSDATDANRLHDLKADLDARQVYSWSVVERLVRMFLDGVSREKLDPILDTCVQTYISDLDEDAQVDFKGKAKGFVRSYLFLATVLPYTNAEWEKLSIFLNFLIPKLPAPKEEDLAKGILETIDMDSYRAEVRATQKLLLPDSDAEIPPIQPSGGGSKAELEMERLSEIIKEFNDLFGGIDWEDRDRIRRIVTIELPEAVRADTKYQNAMKNSDRSAAKLEHDSALGREILKMLTDQTQFFKQFSDNPDFKAWLLAKIFDLTYRPPDASGE